MTEPIYSKGDVVDLHCDIFPGFVHPEPPGVPASGVRKRVVVTERCLTIGWSVAGVVQRIDIPMTVEDTSATTLRGGIVGPYEVGRDGGCPSCGAGAIKNWRPWPGVVMRQAPRTERAISEIGHNPNYGLPSNRYTRPR